MIRGLIGVISIGPIAIIGGLIGLVVGLYNIYLSWLSIQAGMNLPASKALWVILIPILVLILGCCGILALLTLALTGSSSS